MIFGHGDDFSTPHYSVSDFSLECVLADLVDRVKKLKDADSQLTVERRRWEEKKEELRQEIQRLTRRDIIFCDQIKEMAAEIAVLTQENESLRKTHER